MSKKEEPEVKEKIADQEAQQNESTENAEETTENSQEETVEQTEGESVNEFEEKYTEVNDKYLRCLLYTSDAADDSLRVDLGGRRIIKKFW